MCCLIKQNDVISKLQWEYQLGASFPAFIQLLVESANALAPSVDNKATFLPTKQTVTCT